MPERQAEIKNARVAQLVERDLAKVEAAGSSPVSRFKRNTKKMVSNRIPSFCVSFRARSNAKKQRKYTENLACFRYKDKNFAEKDKMLCFLSRL